MTHLPTLHCTIFQRMAPDPFSEWLRIVPVAAQATIRGTIGLPDKRSLKYYVAVQ